MTKYRNNCSPDQNLVEQQKSQITAEVLNLLPLAQTYNLAEGSKITKATSNQPSKIIDKDGQDITPSNIASFSHSILNYEGTNYILLHDVIFFINLEDDDRGLRMGKLVVNEANELFFLKIIEISKSLYDSSQKYLTSEMQTAYELGEAPHNKFIIRKSLKQEEIKVYLLLRYRGLPLDIIIKAPTVSNWQKLDLIVQCLILVRENCKKGYIHRDIKLENFVAEFDERTECYKVCLVDFEYSVRSKSSSYTSFSLLGTSYYHSPSLRNSLLYYVYNFKTEMFAAAVSIGRVMPKIDKSLSTNERTLYEKLEIFSKQCMLMTLSENEIKSQIRIFEREIDQIKYSPNSLGFQDAELNELYQIRVAVRNLVADYTRYIEQNYRGILSYSLTKNHGKEELERAWRLEEDINQAQSIQQVKKIFKGCIDSCSRRNLSTHNHSLMSYVENNSKLSQILQSDSRSNDSLLENS